MARWLDVLTKWFARTSNRWTKFHRAYRADLRDRVKAKKPPKPQEPTPG